MIKTLIIKISCVICPIDDALGSKAKLRTAREAANTMADYVATVIKQQVPKGYVCSLAVGYKNEDEEHAGPLDNLDKQEPNLDGADQLP